MLLKGSKSSQSYDFYTLDIDLNLCCGFFIQNGKSFTTFNQGRKKKKKIIILFPNSSLWDEVESRTLLCSKCSFLL